MELTDTNPPPELAAWFSQYVSLDPIQPDGTRSARTRRSVRDNPSNIVNDEPRNNLLFALYYLATVIQRTNPGLDVKRFIKSEHEAIQQGIFNPDYWRLSRPLMTRRWTETPTNQPDQNPPPYMYREQDQLPSISTYDAGTETSESPSYNGAVVAGRFVDQQLTWESTLHELPYKLSGPKNRQAIVEIYTEILITADDRGSRPMVSLIFDARSDIDANVLYDYNINPAKRDIGSGAIPNLRGKSFYWRFDMPATTPPYYNLFLLRRSLASINYSLLSNQPAESKYLQLVKSLRPMFGRGWNNNSFVRSEAFFVEKIYMPNECYGQLLPEPITVLGPIDINPPQNPELFNLTFETSNPYPARECYAFLEQFRFLFRDWPLYIWTNWNGYKFFRPGPPWPGEEADWQFLGNLPIQNWAESHPDGSHEFYLGIKDVHQVCSGGYWPGLTFHCKVPPTNCGEWEL